MVAGAGYRHHVVLQGAVDGAARVHVYLEGDGRPFVTRHQAAADPSARRALARELMLLDRTPSLYLARPCYDGTARDTGCAPALWTRARYGETVVASMSAALKALRRAHRFEHCTLIGYSGGGVLAMLIAERVAAVDQVVTLAGNLDVAAWSAYHRYTPLGASLDPARRPPLRQAIEQWHYAGADDGIAPPGQIRAAATAQIGARFRQLPGVGHVDGWLERWPQLLTEFRRPPAP